MPSVFTWNADGAVQTWIRLAQINHHFAIVASKATWTNAFVIVSRDHAVLAVATATAVRAGK